MNIWKVWDESADLVLYTSHALHPRHKRFFVLPEKHKEEFERLHKIVMAGKYTSRDELDLKNFANELENDCDCWSKDLSNAHVLKFREALVVQWNRCTTYFKYVSKTGKQEPKIKYEITEEPGSRTSVRDTTKSVWNGERFVDVVY